MDQRHQEYAEYYKSRMRKYENNPLYSNSYAAEKAMYEAIAGAADLDDFKKRMEGGDLNFKVAVALVRDQEIARKKHFEEMNQPIKAKGCVQILAALDSCSNVMDLVTTTNELRQKNSLEQSVDGFVGEIYSNFAALENMEEYKRAEVPSRWKTERQQGYDDTVAAGRKNYREVRLPRAREWDPNWRMDYDLVWQDRHRRLIPVKDDTLRRRVQEHKTYWGV